MHISELLDTGLLAAHVAAGYVRTQVHPERPWTIHNYTDVCTWERLWDDVTLQCRGLVTDADGTVLARPFRKFFNLDEPGAPALDMADRVVVSDKVDGSLGILLPDGSIATRGSFASEQADWATEHYRLRYHGAWDPEPGWTYLFEIVYPANRIVVDYGDMADLVLLGAVNIATGQERDPAHAAGYSWPGPYADTFPYTTLHDALQAPDRDNAEGFVVQRLSDGARVKVKYEEYKRLHRFMTMVTPRHVWEALAAGRSLDEEFAGAPDEFHGWVREVAAELIDAHGALLDGAVRAFADVIAELPDGFSRKEFAEVASRLDSRAYLFRLLDGKPVDDLAWREVKPSAQYTVRKVSSDAN